MGKKYHIAKSRLEYNKTVAQTLSGAYAMTPSIAKNLFRENTTVIISGLHSPNYLYFGKILNIRYDNGEPVECLVLFPMLGQMLWYAVAELDTLETYYGPADGFKFYYGLDDFVKHIVTGEIGQVYNIRDISLRGERGYYNSSPCYTIRQDGGNLFYAYAFELDKAE